MPVSRPPRMTLTLRLFAAIAGTAALISALLLVGQRFVDDAGTRMQETLHRHVHPLARLSAMQAQVSRMRTIEIELPHLADPFAIAEQIETLRKERVDFESNLGAVVRELGTADPGSAAALTRHWKNYAADLAEVAEAMASQRVEDLRRLSAFRSSAHYRAVFIALRRLAETTDRDAERAYADTLAEHDRQRAVFLWASVAGLALIVAWHLLFAQTLRSRLRGLQDAANSLAEGQQHEIAPEGDDELTDLGATFNAMQSRVVSRERALAASEARFRDLAEAASDWFWETGPDLRLAYVSERFYQVTGRTPENTLGRRLSEIADPCDAPDIDDPWADYARWTANRQGFRDFELIVASGEGTLSHLSVTGKPVLDDAGEFLGYRGTGADVGERVTARADALRAETLAALSTQVAGIAHEVNTPLGSSLTIATTLADEFRQFERAAADGLRRSDLDRLLEVNREGLPAIERSLHRAADLIGSFKQVAVDQASDERRAFDLATYLRETLLTLSPLLKRTPHAIDLDCPDGIAMDTFPGALSQVVTNLVTNSLLHGFEGKDAGRIRLAARRDGATVVLAYSDDGRGMPPEVAAHLYEPFFTTKRGRGGSGLGMHIVRHLVKDRLRGEITLRTAPGQGVAFDVRLPARVVG